MRVRGTQAEVFTFYGTVKDYRLLGMFFFLTLTSWEVFSVFFSYNTEKKIKKVLLLSLGFD